MTLAGDREQKGPLPPRPQASLSSSRPRTWARWAQRPSLRQAALCPLGPGSSGSQGCIQEPRRPPPPLLPAPPGEPGTPAPTSLRLAVPNPFQRPWSRGRTRGAPGGRRRGGSPALTGPGRATPAGTPGPLSRNPLRPSPRGPGWGVLGPRRPGPRAPPPPTRRAHSLPNSAPTRPRAELQAAAGRGAQPGVWGSQGPGSLPAEFPALLAPAQTRTARQSHPEAPTWPSFGGIRRPWLGTPGKGARLLSPPPRICGLVPTTPSPKPKPKPSLGKGCRPLVHAIVPEGNRPKFKSGLSHLATPGT